MYAVIESGGKQHRVVEGEVLKLEKIEVSTGDTAGPAAHRPRAITDGWSDASRDGRLNCAVSLSVAQWVSTRLEIWLLRVRLPSERQLSAENRPHESPRGAVGR